MVHFVLLLQSTQDGDGFGQCRFVDQDLLESSFECLVLFDVFAVFTQRGSTDAVQLTAGQHGFQEVCRIHTSLAAGACSHEQMDLIHEQDNGVLGIFNLLEDTLHSLFELSTELASRD